MMIQYVGWQDIEEICCFGPGIYCYYWGIAVDEEDQGLGPERGFVWEHE